jgi:glycosyltransferase involved in cell wall biosynthesis
LEAGETHYYYPDEVKYTLNTHNSIQYAELANTINLDVNIEFVVVQHEFGFFQQADKDALLQFLYWLTKPTVIEFHTVLPMPERSLRTKVRGMAAACDAVVVMTRTSAKILHNDYGVPSEKIIVIPHGTHLVPHLDKEHLKAKYGISGRKVLSTFGLLGSGKGIETTLNSLPSIIAEHRESLFLIIGKTHPGVVESEGEKYRIMLEQKVAALGLEHHVEFINRYLPLHELLEYLQLTDIYLFTSRDPNQAVSGTFSYAMSCGCPIISTPIPHAQEMLSEATGIIIDFENSEQLATGVNRLMSDETLCRALSSNTLQHIVPTAWENSAIAHALLLKEIAENGYGAETSSGKIKALFQKSTSHHGGLSLEYRLPPINLDHVKKMTDDVGIIQFAHINQPDKESGYTLDDNARALVAMCMHYESTGDKEDLKYIRTYLNFIHYCQQTEGEFLNYVGSDKKFTTQNTTDNLADAHGRAVWALGYCISCIAILPPSIISLAEWILQGVVPHIGLIHSTRAMAFIIKGLHYSNLERRKPFMSMLIKILANRLVQMFRHESEQGWQWYESYLTYANSIIPEAMLCAWLETGDATYKTIAKTSFDFLLSLTFNEHEIKVISNQTWLYKGQTSEHHGEQPIDVAYTILALHKFYDVLEDESYSRKMTTAFNWFLGNNHLHQIMYNPCTGGCYDGLEETQVNLNQGAESTLSYLLARLTVEQHNHIA